MDAKQSAEQLRHEAVSAIRKRNAEHADIPDAAEFEQFVGLVEDIGALTETWARAGIPALTAGRALQYYSKAIAVQVANDG